MKLIFLDIDGVLNCVNSKQYMPAPYSSKIKYVGIDEDKLLNLKQDTYLPYVSPARHSHQAKVNQIFQNLYVIGLMKK